MAQMLMFFSDMSCTIPVVKMRFPVWLQSNLLFLVSSLFHRLPPEELAKPRFLLLVYKTLPLPHKSHYFSNFQFLLLVILFCVHFIVPNKQIITFEQVRFHHCLRISFFFAIRLQLAFVPAVFCELDFFLVFWKNFVHVAYILACAFIFIK